MTKLIYATIVAMIFPFLAVAQSAKPISDTSLFIAFYNVENLFDPENDSLKNDDSFTLEGFNRWGYTKFRKKLNHLSKVIMAMNDFSIPDMVAMCEVENRNCVEQLCRFTPLHAFDYDFVHYESSDNRGIDVVLLYRTSKIKVLSSRLIPIIFPFEPGMKREIMYVEVQPIGTKDTLHLFVNHWTSRYSGAAATIPKRNYYAQVVRKNVDSLLLVNPNSQILIMGDFNDYPDDESFLYHLKTESKPEKTNCAALINLMSDFAKTEPVGTHKNHEHWGALDQFIVTANFFNRCGTWQLSPPKAQVFKAPFLLVPDEKYGGVKNFRTFLGPRYIGGYSDHLPVYVVIEKWE